MGRKRRTRGTKRRAVGPARNTSRQSSQGWIIPTALAAVVLGGVWTLRSIQPSQASPAAAPSSASVATPQAQPVVRSLRVDVLREFSHERDAYTQGLVWWNDWLFESTGLEGQSTLRRLNVQTGQVEQRIDLPAQYFGEGLALVDRRLIMLTLRAERAFTFDRASFELGATFRYQGDGWGLCYDGTRLVMSDGSDRLTFRDPVTFEPVGELRVRLRGQPLRKLNELECVNGMVYANVYQEDFLVRIDPKTGRVTDYIDATDLIVVTDLLPGEDRVGDAVLNGIAYDPVAETFYITGKRWPKMFEVRFVE